jgi:hypothetical protein
MKFELYCDFKKKPLEFFPSIIKNRTNWAYINTRDYEPEYKYLKAANEMFDLIYTRRTTKTVWFNL